MVFTDKALVCADSVQELLKFAGKVGLDPYCFSHGGLAGHYMISSPEILAEVIEAGAKVVERWEFCEKCLAAYPRG